MNPAGRILLLPGLYIRAPRFRTFFGNEVGTEVEKVHFGPKNIYIYILNNIYIKNIYIIIYKFRTHRNRMK